MPMRLAVLTALASLSLGGLALADEQQAIDGCIDKVREVGGPDAQGGGEVMSSDFSQAGTTVMLRDAGGTVWRCLASNDGTVEDIAISEAMDDGEGAMDGAGGTENEGVSSTERVKFPAGSSGTSFDAHLTPGSSVDYLLGAKNGQFLNVAISAQGGGISYQIFNPDGSALLDLVSSGTPYRGQLWQSGDHTIEVINRGNQDTNFTIDFSVE